MSEQPPGPNKIDRVLVTGATGFVGRHVVRRLLASGYTPVCLVRSASRLFSQHKDVGEGRLIPIVGDLSSRKAVRQAADMCQAAIHLVGIIIARRLRGQTFQRVHVQGTINVVDMVRSAGIRRYLHMSALGTRPDAVSAYHRTKWQAEEYVRKSGLDWTVFRPSLIHGPDGEFMQLMHQFMCGLVPPVIPYFGSGQAKIQPVFVNDVAACFVDALTRSEAIGQTFALGGPRTYSWVELYETCRAHIPGARTWKPLVSLPVPIAKAAAVASAPVMSLAESIVPSLGLMRFDRGQVQMAQEDSTCDHTIAEQAFGLKMRAFEDELAVYAHQIGS